MPRLFGMVTTANSSDYTLAALESFFNETSIGKDDRFLLIDNDNTSELDSILELKKYPQVEVLVHDKPHSFAENINIGIKEAQQRGADLYFLNNDLIFTADWDIELDVKRPIIISSTSNQNFTYRTKKFTLRGPLSLENYLDHVEHFNNIVKTHKSLVSGLKPVVTTPYYCVKIPQIVYEEVGFFDECFVVGGGEDTDYSIRTYLKGFGVYVALKSFVLHFVGRSTWCGGETPSQTKIRESNYINRLYEKWGQPLTDTLVKGWHSEPAIMRLYNAGKGKELIERLKSEN